MNTFKHFLKWWEKEQDRFHCGHFNDQQIAYSAWLASIKHIKSITKEQTTKN